MSGWVKGFLIALGIVALAILTAPWWLGAAARPVVSKYGVTYGRYETRGYTAFTLHDVRYARGNTEVTIGRAESAMPLLWGWQFLTGGDRKIFASDWKVTVSSPTTPQPESKRTVTGMPSLHAQLERVVEKLRRFLPELTAENGVVLVRAHEIKIPHATWSNARLATKDVEYRAFRGDVSIAHEDGKLRGKIASPAWNLDGELEWSRGDIQGDGKLWEQPWTLAATFPENGWWPSDGKVKARDWTIPAERIRLGQAYAEARGDIDIEWSGEGFHTRVSARAEPREGSKAPAVTAEAEAEGTGTELRISRLELESPFARARLTKPVVMGFNGGLNSEPAALQLTADLEQAPWFEATGAIEGRVTVGGKGAATKGEFDLTANALELPAFRARHARIRGTWTIPEISVTEASVALDEQTTLRGRGGWNWRSRELTGVSVSGRVDPKSVERWLPAGATWEQADLDIRVHGPIGTPTHEGSLRGVGFTLSWLHPTSFNAQWRGRGTQVEELSLRANSGEARLNAVAAVGRDQILVNQLDLVRSDGQMLKLAAPATVAWRPVFAVRDLNLTGDDRGIRVTLPSTEGGEVLVGAANFDDQWLRDWMKLPGPRWSLAALDLRGRQENKAFAFEISGDAKVRVRDRDVRLQLDGAGNDSGLRVTRLAVVRDGGALTQATGELPIVTSLAPNPSFKINYDGPMVLKAEVRADSGLWPLLTEISGIAIDQATVAADLQGTLNRPTGAVRLDIAALEATRGKAKGKIPKVTELALVARANVDSLTLESFAAKIAGQPVNATARLPLPSGTWEQLRANPDLLDWRKAEAKLQTENVELAELARTLPILPVIKGRLNASLALADGRIAGDLQFFNASSRPIPGMGVLQNVHANVKLADRDLTISAFRGELGGEPVDLSGSASFADLQKPRLNLTLKGRNLPLIRRPGLLVRTDLNLRAVTTDAGVTSIAGDVELRDSLVLADLAAILPGGPRGVGRQPPYFSVSQKPFNEWPLAVQVRGSRAVRVRTAVFNGVASANFDLTGTLGEPRAIGQLTVDEGRVLFPFATFEVQNGAVRISQADPHRLQLNINAMARRHGYELRLEAGGTVASPVVTLSSNPPLEAAEVLMMVTTGQPPTDDTSTLTNQQRLTQLGAYVGKGLLQNFGVGDGEARLEISSGEDVSRQGRETYQLEYRLNEKWALTGEYDEFDEYNAGVKWRVYEQGGKRDAKKDDERK